ncbi:MAG: hypothetical protein OI74_13205 [Gammaproteobacteria bacterium (ex Lamellibrachia satsuma)]|nr:MAG: hypothetical protein HPY30_01640 [Gammaproteobacteria bacterium (ex Lamellibrachia satsuma)]RRS31825.1 MAG: hypothetical protein OI74_13205 [Gammaproteobacteria bacterium (ex Lamellibrachia satsuma)]RRS37047.1 MAG: hypothetical protein NV67_03315 [Gammaproteobacteria bacterium (ex Lamellibrachia satsuma)]
MNPTDPENIDLNELDIPLLDDVVQSETLISPTSEPSKESIDEQADFQPIPDHDAIISIVREGLQDQLNHELSSIVQQAVEQAVTQATTQLKQVIGDEVTSSLERRIKQLVERALDEKFGDLSQQ